MPTMTDLTGVAVRYIDHHEDHRIRPAEYGVMVSAPSDCAESGTAYVAFIERGTSPVSVGLAEQAAYALAHFNGELDRLREYRSAILRAAYAA